MANANLHQRDVTVFRNLSPQYALTLKAGGTINPNRILLMASDGDLEQAGAGELQPVGVYPGVSVLAAGDFVDVAYGLVAVEADLPVTAGEGLKCGAAGKAISHIDSALSGTTIEDNVGLGFANQPANDGVELVSDDAGDTTQQVTIYGTTNGVDTVVKETKTLNGTTPVATTKVDWGLILAVVMDSVAAGTVTVREASGDLAITTMTTGTLSKGFIAVTAGQERAFNVAPTAVASGASTKQIGLLGTNSASAELLDSQALNGTTPVTMNSAFRTVTHLLVGDIAGATTATVKVGAAEDEGLRIATALESAAAAGDVIFAMSRFG